MCTRCVWVFENTINCVSSMIIIRHNFQSTQKKWLQCICTAHYLRIFESNVKQSQKLKKNHYHIIIGYINTLVLDYNIGCCYRYCILVVVQNYYVVQFTCYVMMMLMLMIISLFFSSFDLSLFDCIVYLCVCVWRHFFSTK